MTSLFKKLSVTTLSLGLLGGIVFSIGSSEISQFEVAAVGDNMRRIYAYPEAAMNKDSWDDDVIHIHYWGGSSSSTYSTAPQMILAVGDYSYGLLYYDIPADSTSFMLAAIQNTGDDWRKTNDITLNNDNKFFGFKIINSYTNGKVNVYQENIGMTAAQFSGVLYHVNSCGTGYASGYNSYEYLIRTFVKKADGTNIMSTTEQNAFSSTTYADMNNGSTFSIDGLNRTAGNTTITQKLTILQRQFNADSNNTDINYI